MDEEEVELAVAELEEEGLVEVVAPEPPKLDVNITRTVSTKIDAKVQIDNKRTLYVRSLNKGIKLAVVTKVRVNYYQNRNDRQEMVLQDDEAEFVIEALQAVVDARKASE